MTETERTSIKEQLIDLFKWMNESKIVVKESRIEIEAPAKTDFFCGSEDECKEGFLPESLCNAPYY